jgi:hypothetical protein
MKKKKVGGKLEINWKEVILATWLIGDVKIIHVAS